MHHPPIEILRVEDLEGVGPYDESRPGRKGAHYAHRTCAGTALCTRAHPEPSQDSSGIAHDWHAVLVGKHPTITKKTARFGFSTHHQYLAWFNTPEIRKMLRGFGFHLSIYSCPPNAVILGEKQAVFDTRTASFIRRNAL